jgi:hypothetical protein
VVRPHEVFEMPSLLSGLPRRAAITALCLIALVATRPARSAVPEAPLPGVTAPTPDSSGFLPRWLHLHGSIGIGWVSSPEFLRERYEAGQDFEMGLEMRLQPRLRLRLNGEYQVLPALGRVNYQYVVFQDIDAGTAMDTISFDWRKRGWLGAARAEVQWRALPHTWLLVGGGRGYLGAGQRPYHFRSPFETLDIEFPGSSGWAWIGSLGARYEFDIFGPVLGAELRWSALDRRQDELQTWSIRIGWQGK